MLTLTENKKYKSRHADDKQKELYKKFPTSSFLGNETNMDHVFRWITFFRRNLHRFAMDYLGVTLHPFQAIALYFLGISQFIAIIACRAASKSFIIAIYACCRCILYPHTQFVLSSATKGQARLIVTEKIETELMSKFSPVLRKEIVGIKNNQNEIIVRFRSKSTIIVVIANDNARGNRSNVVVREEFRQIKKKIDDSILSPFQVIRQPPYIIDPYYANIKELQEEPVNIYISSSWLDPHWMWGIVDNAYEGMLNGTGEYLLAFDESITLKHNIRTQKQMQTERKKQDPFTWAVEFLNMRLKENQHAFFTYNMFLDNQKIKRPFYPRTTVDFKTGKKNPYDIPKQAGEIRVVACDMAFVTRDGNDNSVFSCMRLLPDYTTYNRKDDGDVLVENGFRKLIPYIESVQGGDTVRQALRIRQLFEDFHADYIVLDLRNAGRNAA